MISNTNQRCGSYSRCAQQDVGKTFGFTGDVLQHTAAEKRVTALEDVPLRSTVGQLEELAEMVTLLEGDIDQDRAIAITGLRKHVWFHWSCPLTHATDACDELTPEWFNFVQHPVDTVSVVLVYRCLAVKRRSFPRQ